MRKWLVLVIGCSMLLFGCGGTLYADIATLKEVHEDFIVIEYWNGEKKEITISSVNDFDFEVNQDYLFNYELNRKNEAVLVSVEE